MSTKDNQVNKLKTMESFMLIGFMSDPQTGYAAKGLTDREYAEYFNQGDKEFKITEGNVAGARKALGLPATKNVATQAARTAATEVLEYLSRMDDKINRIYKYLSEQAKRDL